MHFVLKFIPDYLHHVSGLPMFSFRYPRKVSHLADDKIKLERHFPHVHCCKGVQYDLVKYMQNSTVEFAMYVSTHGWRKPRTWRSLFTDYIYCPLRDPDSLLNDNQLLEMAQNRHRWMLWLNALQLEDDDDVDESYPTDFWQLFSIGVKLK